MSEDAGDERPGVRRHRHPPGLLHTWVFDQHQVWVDVHGSEHEIESMPLDYVLNVWTFCVVQADRIRDLCLRDDAIAVLDTEQEGRSDGLPSLFEQIEKALGMPAVEWLCETPLMRALSWRLLRTRRVT